MPDAPPMADRPPHVLVVTADDNGVPTYTMECPGVTDACRAWQPCERQHTEAERDALYSDGGLVHGARHAYLDAGWCTATDDCIARVAPDMPDAADEYVGANPGRYPVHVEWDDGLVLHDAEEPTDA